MVNMRFVIAGILCVAAVQARAQSFEQQLFQISQNASATARQNRQVFLNVQAAAIQGPAAWQKLSGFNDTFTIEMPAVPVYTASPAKTNTDVAYTQHLYAVDAGARAFICITAIYPPEVDSNLQAALDGTAKGLGIGKWTSVTWTKHQGLPAVEAIVLKDGNEFRTLWVLRGNQRFGVMYIGPDGTARSEDANRFISSLNIR